jgi:uncharacterized protein (TIGR02266 family)
MSDERRTTHRAQVPGVHATYETASGDLQRAEVLDLAVGGLFLRTDAPAAVGKRVALDIEVKGEAAPWSALGRVVWIRPATVDEERPAGMAIKLIDIDDDVRVGIERLVAMRERTEPGVGGAATPEPGVGGASSPEPGVGGAATPEPPPKERTVLGVGVPTPNELVPTPVAFVPVEVEMPVQVEAEPPPAATASPIAREASIAIDLVARKSIPVEAAIAAGPETRDAEAQSVAEAPSSEAGRAKKGRGRGGWLLLLAVLVAAMAAYAFREQLLSVWHGVSS